MKFTNEFEETRQSAVKEIVIKELITNETHLRDELEARNTQIAKLVASIRLQQIELKLRDSMADIAALDHAEELRQQKAKFLISTNYTKSTCTNSAKNEVQRLQWTIGDYTKRLRESEELCDEMRMAFKTKMNSLRKFFENTSQRHKEKEESLEEELVEVQNQLGKAKSELKHYKRRLADTADELDDVRKVIVHSQNDKTDVPEKPVTPQVEKEVVECTPKTSKTTRRKQTRSRKKPVKREESPELFSEPYGLDDPEILPSKAEQQVDPQTPGVPDDPSPQTPASPQPTPSFQPKSPSPPVLSSQPVPSSPPLSSSQPAPSVKPASSSQPILSSQPVPSSQPISSQSRPKRRKLGGKSRAYLLPEEGCLSPLSELINKPA
ncbi:hypothetical protein DFQ28_008647 [Apophysomyces sp. BC1034]|nr:hypothetical protein DFQ29_006636 [Apophysomyces sp. BC1021]KAG0185868.1 hypothetical protein DFQ28_008647 [Apophysomyces sp. BC1034]